MGKSKDQLKTGVLLSYLNLAVSCLIPFLYTPIMLRILGRDEYGLYSLAQTSIGYLSLLTFGFGSTILRYLSIYRAKGQKEEEQKTLGFFLALYCLIGVLIMIGGVVLSSKANVIFRRGLTASELEKIRVLMLIIAASSAISLPVSVLSSLVMAHERYLFKKTIELCSTILIPVGYLVVLYLGYASLGMAIASALIHASFLPIYGIYCFRVLKVRPVFARLPKALLKEMVGVSAFVFLATIVDMLFWSTDRFLLGMMLGTASVAVYNIGGTFNSMVMSLSSAIVSVLSPRITGMVAKNADSKELSALFIRTGRLQFLIVALIVSGFTVFGRSFIHLWAGDEYADAYWIAILTMFPLCIPLIQNTGISILVAKNKHAFRSVVYSVIAVANVISTILVIPTLGEIGAALCSGVSYLLGQGLIMNFFYWKKIGLDIPLFWRNILKMSILPLAMLAAGLAAVRYVVIDSWMVFLVFVAIYTGIYVLGMYHFALNEQEKELILGRLKKAKKAKTAGTGNLID